MIVRYNYDVDFIKIYVLVDIGNQHSWWTGFVVVAAVYETREIKATVCEDHDALGTQ